MANHKSAKKRAVQNIKRRDRNRSYMSSVKSAVKKFTLGLDEHKAGKIDVDAIQLLFKGAQSALQRAASKGLLHRNNASRRTGRLAQKLPTTKA